MTAFAGGITTDIYDTYLSVLFELRKHERRRRLLIVLGIAIVVPLLFNIIPARGTTPFTATAATFAAAVMSFAAVLIAISAALFAGDAVSGEYENKTGLLLFPTPQGRTAIFVGKFIGALLATWLVISLYYVVTAAEVAVIYGAGDFPAKLATSYGLALLYGASAVSIVFFFSSLMKRAISSTIVSFLFLIMVLPIIETILQITDINPWFLVTYSASLIPQRLGEVAFGPGGGGFAQNFTPDLHTGIGVMAVYALAFFAIGILAATRKDME
jgi:ABC-type transport system involved in multi-copper enzyme maturation permease subunit